MSNTGTREKDDMPTSGAGASNAALAAPARPRMTRYTVLNAVVNGENPIFRWDPTNSSLSGPGNHSTMVLNTVEEESESLAGLVSTQSVGALVSANGISGPAAAKGETVSAADICNRAAAHVQSMNKGFMDRQTVILKFAPYNKKLLALLSSDEDTNDAES
jgi:hypothetical protein